MCSRRVWLSPPTTVRVKEARLRRIGRDDDKVAQIQCLVADPDIPILAEFSRRALNHEWLIEVGEIRTVSIRNASELDTSFVIMTSDGLSDDLQKRLMAVLPME